MKCPRCQAESTDSARFSEDFGARLHIIGAACSQPVGADKTFCRAPAALRFRASRLASPRPSPTHRDTSPSVSSHPRARNGPNARRRLMRAREPQTWAPPWAVEADLPSDDVTVVQAAGGHAPPTYDAGDWSSPQGRAAMALAR